MLLIFTFIAALSGSVLGGCLYEMVRNYEEEFKKHEQE